MSNTLKPLLLILILCCLTTNLQAQPRDQDFFDKNFAKSPLENNPDGSDSKQPNVVQPSPAPISAHEVVTPGFVELGPTVTPVASAKPQDAFGTRIYAIGAIINAHDTKHFSANINQLVQVCRDRKLAIARIYAVASLSQYGSAIEPFMTNDWRMLTTFEFINHIVPVVKPPEQYATSRSPTWLFATDQGIIVAEGYTNLSSLLTQDGLLKDLSAETHVTPTPNPVPSPIAQQ